MVPPPVPPSAVGRGTADTPSEVLSRQLRQSGKLCWTLVSDARSTARCNSGFAFAATAAQVAARGLDNMSTRVLVGGFRHVDKLCRKFADVGEDLLLYRLGNLDSYQNLK
jgi:hypothetical protein